MDFYERMRKVMSEGLDTTRKGMEQAATKARELGEKGVLKYEIMKLEKEVERKFAILGGNTFRLIAEKGQSKISADAPEVKELIAEVKDLQRRIEGKERALIEVGKK